MGKFTYVAVLVAAVLLGSVMVAEAAPPIKAVGPRAVVMLKKAGTGISNFLWKNKGAVTTGVVLGTFAMNPDPFVEGATTVATAAMGDAPKIGVYLLLAALFAAGVSAAVLAIRRVQWRRHLVPIAVFLIVFFVICCAGVAVRADTIGTLPLETTSSGLSPGWFRIALNVIMVILMLPFGC